MAAFQARVDVIQKYVDDHPSAGRIEITKATGIPGASVQRALKKIRRGVLPPLMPKTGGDEKPTDKQREIETTLCRTAPTLAGLLEQCHVDLAKEQVDRHVINKFEQGSKHPETGAVTVTELYQIKAWLSPVPGAAESTVVKDTIEWIRANSPVAKVATPVEVKNLAADDSVMLEMSIPDVHYGKLTHAPETGENYDIKIAAQVHQQAVEALWYRASVFPVHKILFAASGDIFNVDNDKNETTAGTPQSEDQRWAKTFTGGVAMLHKAIEFLRTKVPDVEVRFIGGNHDRTRLFYAGEVIAAMYAGVPGVTVVNQPRVRQYVQWGTVLLGLAHGDGAKQDKLPLLMASESPVSWGHTTHREFHIGHFHSMRETQYHAGNEHNAVRVRILPSLTTTDFWHSLNGFVAQKRAAESYLWSKKHGYLGHFSWSV